MKLSELFRQPVKSGQRASQMSAGIGIEALEARIAPAILLNPTTVRYMDLDGDLVTVKFSKPIFNLDAPDSFAKVNAVFKFGNAFGINQSNAVNGNVATFEQLQLIDLTVLTTGDTNVAFKTSITITSEGAGDGFANVGAIVAAGLPLKAVTVDGDLGRISAGANTQVIGLKSLKVNSMGVQLLATQMPGPGASLQSVVVGAIGSINVATDVIEAGIFAINGAPNPSGVTTAFGNIGKVTIGDDLIGRVAVEAASDNTGSIQAAGKIGAVKIGGDIIGGGGANSGSVIASGKIAGLTVGGRIIGGSGDNSGTVYAGIDSTIVGTIGPVNVGIAVLGGIGINSGVISADGKLGSVTIGGLLTPADPLALGNALAGGLGNNSGSISSGSTIGSVKFFGNVIGGVGNLSATVASIGKFSKLSITGDMVGGDGDGSGAIYSRDLASAQIAGNLGGISVSGALTGGAGLGSGKIEAEGSITKITLGSMSAGAGIFSGTGPLQGAKAGQIKILGIMDSSDITIGGALGNLSVTGAVTLSTIRVANNLSAFSAASLTDSTLSARGQAVQGRTSDVAFGKVTVLGDVTNSQILAGYNLNGAGVNPDAQIGRVTVAGNWSASDLVAGIADTGTAGFGDSGDTVISGANSARIISKIASVLIAGTVTGTASPTTDHFGFVAEVIGAFKVGTPPVAVSVTTVGTELDAINTDVTAREI